MGCYPHFADETTVQRRCSVKIACLVSGDLNAGLGIDFNYLSAGQGENNQMVNKKKESIDPGTE